MGHEPGYNARTQEQTMDDDKCNAGYDSVGSVHSWIKMLDLCLNISRLGNDLLTGSLSWGCGTTRTKAEPQEGESHWGHPFM